MTCIQVSQDAGKGVWYSHLFKNSPQFVVIHTVKTLAQSVKQKVMFFWNSFSFSDPTFVDNLISCSSAFSKSSLNIWKVMVYVLLKPGLENFEHYFTSM